MFSDRADLILVYKKGGYYDPNILHPDEEAAVGIYHAQDDSLRAACEKVAEAFAEMCDHVTSHGMPTGIALTRGPDGLVAAMHALCQELDVKIPPSE